MPNPADAFTPAQPIDDPARFAGRRDELDNLAEALQIPGGHIVIYGNRGIGKSSLAKQLMQLSQGNQLILERLKHRPTPLPDFLPIYIQCDDSIQTLQHLLVRLLTLDSALAPWLPFKVVSQETQVRTGSKATIKIIELSGTDESTVVQKRPEIEQDLVTIFINSLDHIIQSNIAASGILIVIDEFDRISDRSGIASLLKSLDHKVKVALVGVSQNVAELVRDHESIARQLAGGCVLVSPMTSEEIYEILDRAEQILGSPGMFVEETRKTISLHAKGHPFLVQLLGYQATQIALREGARSVGRDHVERALSEIAAKKSAPIQEELYRKAVGHSYTREVILKKFANVADDEMRTTPVYQSISAELRMFDQNAISVYMGHLTSDKYGAVLIKTRDRHYRFKDSLFKAYAASRPFLLEPGSADTN